MIIEYHLQGSQTLHKGLFDTEGLYIRYNEIFEDGYDDEPSSYTLHSNFSFSYEHWLKHKTDEVYEAILTMLSIAHGQKKYKYEHILPNIGYLKLISL